MNVLGISAFYHDSSAALVKDGKLISAASEERFSRIKHDNSFPQRSINFCLRALSPEKIDYVAYYEKPLLKFERILETFIDTYPFSLKPFVAGIPSWLGEKLKIADYIQKETGLAKNKILYVPHHLSHASAAFYPSPFKKAAILTLDGVGEYESSVLWSGEGKNISPIRSIIFPTSLGLLYSVFTSFLGFRVNEDEYKVMGLAAYGIPLYLRKIKEIVELKEDGSFKLNLEYFSFRESFQMWNDKFVGLFGRPRLNGQKIEVRHRNIAASIQKLTEEIYIRVLKTLYKDFHSKNLCLGGGVALNAVANGKIFERTGFKRVFVFGPAGDDGAAAGAALLIQQKLSRRKERFVIDSLSLGTFSRNKEIKRSLAASGLRYEKFASKEKLCSKIATLISRGKIVGIFRGRMEFGPRALGNRSILARTQPFSMKNKINRIKKREKFRPFAAAVLEKFTKEVFEVPASCLYFSPHMTFCFRVKRSWRKRLSAVLHKDGTCRVQTVSNKDGFFYELISSYFKKTGMPCLLNTSFNLSGEPIVETPSQAISDFLRSEMDCLAIENFLITSKKSKAA